MIQTVQADCYVLASVWQFLWIRMSSLELILVLVRHGEAEQNLKESTAIVDFLEEGEKRLMDSELTSFT